VRERSIVTREYYKSVGSQFYFERRKKSINLVKRWGTLFARATALACSITSSLTATGPCSPSNLKVSEAHETSGMQRAMIQTMQTLSTRRGEADSRTMAVPSRTTEPGLTWKRGLATSTIITGVGTTTSIQGIVATSWRSSPTNSE